MIFPFIAPTPQPLPLYTTPVLNNRMGYKSRNFAASIMNQKIAEKPASVLQFNLKCQFRIIEVPTIDVTIIIKTLEEISAKVFDCNGKF